MIQDSKKAILIVSFGTSFHETREKTIDKIEDMIENAYKNYKIYKAWTSKIIIKKLLKRDNIHVNTVTEAMKEIVKDGIEELIVMPTHILNGVENDIMEADVLAFNDEVSNIVFASPLLTTTGDCMKVILALMDAHKDLSEDEAIVFMGHGTSHHANSVYPAINYIFNDLGYKNAFMATVEGYPSIENVLKSLKDTDYKKVRLAPFMLVAGDHANNDMSGDDDDSWKNIFMANGYEVECQLLGLGEYPQVRSIYLDHLDTAILNLKKQAHEIEESAKEKTLNA
ncbi:anaerobic cobaltochelatase [Acetitomaculum ruminis DSM 5522]|uniref:Anaerobic cobaltochelatase n=1 Tax=Acetitomaculum ruminis DSM 5522 TaxID=1120918 RepID=A0A1I1AA16_9FIRM|nr:sirohydrochlorin cobaltochelatase [Acetitomaculum ruminis]SFB34372.1 anaerobic cobaltochelatase [Acetitomaculum ruminis DSM 5522]